MDLISHHTCMIQSRIRYMNTLRYPSNTNDCSLAIFTALSERLENLKSKFFSDA